MIKRNASRILSLRNDVGLDIQDPDQIRDHISDFFRNLYSTEQGGCSRQRSQSQELIDIAYPPSDAEVKRALNQMKPIKAPGPDGFHPIFFQRMWDTVGHDVCRNIRDWFQQCEVPSEMCQAIICLIPK